MTPFSANPFVFIFSAALLVGVLGYFAYGLLDRIGLTESQARAVITAKQYNAPGKTYNTNIAGGRAWTQAYQTPDTYVLSLNIGQEPTVAIVSKEQYETLRAGDSVEVRLHRTRISGRLEVTEVLQ